MHTTTTLLAALTSATLALANPAPAAEAHPALVTAAPALHPAAARLAARQFRTTDSEISKSIACGSAYLSLAGDAPRETNAALARWVLSAASPAAEIVTATALDESLTSLCDPSLTATLTPPASLSSAWSTYLEKASSWMTSAAPEASSLAQSCGGEIGAVIGFLVVSDAESCTKAVLDLVAAANGEDVTSASDSETVSPTRSRTTAAPEASETGSAGGDDDNGDGGDDGADNGNGGGEDGGSDNGSDETGGAGAAETSSTSTGGVPRETGFVGVAAAAAVAVVGVVAAL
ncbi:predicted protein [Chaetomium globosum CBS 148.51]|uniref:Infection structure specific protein n=1 Tax=Chaetomium globosum (strain ATCC 6205 / CBS 148.51 / DSM 1962 / NBRC 6347 / NRRL 1970) TaxID=306901 RepID=Q2GQ61_CHAGB|nr:uncharacterized protein CHGG_09893 [Chaetomium globosum CBS 148.51]EAQ83489.1 predicted protein [Chaetomium globosum CBS 148.51]